AWDGRPDARDARVALGREAIGRPAATPVDDEPQSPFDVDETDSFPFWVGACRPVLDEHFTPPRQSNVIRVSFRPQQGAETTHPSPLPRSDTRPATCLAALRYDPRRRG